MILSVAVFSRAIVQRIRGAWLLHVILRLVLLCHCMARSLCNLYKQKMIHQTSLFTDNKNLLSAAVKVKRTPCLGPS